MVTTIFWILKYCIWGRKKNYLGHYKNLIGFKNLGYDSIYFGYSKNPAYQDHNHHDDYKVDVISFAAVGGFPASTQNHYFFICENLIHNGYFCSNKVLPGNQVILSILPLIALQDAFIQSDGNVIFNVKNWRYRYMVKGPKTTS